jgi:hypothetical protein
MNPGRLRVWIAAGAIVIVAVGVFLIHDRTLRVYASPAARIVLTDPDEDDVADFKLKTRNNGDGTIRAKIEFDLMEVTEGREYVIRIEVIEVGGDPVTPLETPPLRAQPPR